MQKNIFLLFQRIELEMNLKIAAPPVRMIVLGKLVALQTEKVAKISMLLEQLVLQLKKAKWRTAMIINYLFYYYTNSSFINWFIYLFQAWQGCFASLLPMSIIMGYVSLPILLYTSSYLFVSGFVRLYTSKISCFPRNLVSYVHTSVWLCPIKWGPAVLITLFPLNSTRGIQLLLGFLRSNHLYPVDAVFSVTRILKNRCFP